MMVVVSAVRSTPSGSGSAYESAALFLRPR